MAEAAAEQLPAEGEKPAVKTDYETVARAEGWKSKEELGDEFDSARYVDAEEFMKRKPLFDTIKQQNKKIKELTKTVDSVVNFSQKNAEIAAKRAIAELTAQKKEAIKVGDVDTVETLDKSIKDHEDVIQEAAKAKETKPVPTEIVEWTERNPWFDADIEMQDFATAYCASWAKRHPKDSMETALDETTKAVKKAFPDSKYFKTRRQDPPPVETHKGDGADTRGGNGNKNYVMSRLTEEQKLAYRAYVKSPKPILTHDQYFQKLEEIGALEK
jgi:hypothetical protein